MDVFLGVAVLLLLIGLVGSVIPYLCIATYELIRLFLNR